MIINQVNSSGLCPGVCGGLVLLWYEPPWRGDHIIKRHDKTLLLYHMVFPAKYRRKVFSNGVVTTLKEVCLGIAQRYEISFIEIGMDEDGAAPSCSFSHTKCAGVECRANSAYDSITGPRRRQNKYLPHRRPGPINILK